MNLWTLIIFFTVNQLHKKLKYYTQYKNRPEQGNTLSYIAGKRKAEDWLIKGKKPQLLIDT